VIILAFKNIYILHLIGRLLVLLRNFKDIGHDVFLHVVVRL